MARVEDTTGRLKLLKAGRLKSGRILDVGIGGCACMAFFLARKGFDVTGIDSSPFAIRRARKNALKKRFKGSFAAIQADAHDVPFEDGTFDAIISFHSLHHMDAIVGVIREMFRVCRPGGVVLIADLNDTGRKIYKHKADNHELLGSIERAVNIYSSNVKISDTRLDRLFVCRKSKFCNRTKW